MRARISNNSIFVLFSFLSKLNTPYLFTIFYQQKAKKISDLIFGISFTIKKLPIWVSLYNFLYLFVNEFLQFEPKLIE